MTSKIDRRKFLVTSAKGVVGLAGAGVIAASGSSSSEAASRPTTAAGKPQYGGNLRIGTWTDESSLLPLTTTWDEVGLCYGEAFYDSWMALDVHGNVVPYLAQSLSHNPDYTQWTLTARPNVVYHDGTPLDSANMVANVYAAKESPTLGYIYAPIQSAKAIGPLTVVLTMSEPWVPFDAYLVGAFPQATAQLAASYNGPPIGTGPFVYKSWEPFNHLYVTKNPHYWRPGLPYLDQVSFIPILDSQQKENSLRAGNIDLALVGNAIDNMGSLRADTSLQYIDSSKVKLAESNMIYWILNCSVPPTDDVRVRNAMAYAIDQPTFWKEVFIGSGSAGGSGTNIPVTGPFQPGSPYYELDTGYPQKQDMRKAKQLVAAYKAEKGTPKVTITASTERKELTALELTQSMWQEAGIDVTIQQLDVATYIVRTLKGQYQASYWDTNAAIDPDQNYPVWSPQFWAPVGTIGLEECRLQDPRIQPLLNTGRTDPDPSKRQAAYRQLAKVFGELTPFIYMGRDLGGYSASRRVRNLTTLTSPDGAQLTWAQPGLVATQMWLHGPS